MNHYHIAMLSPALIIAGCISLDKASDIYDIVKADPPTNSVPVAVTSTPVVVTNAPPAKPEKPPPLRVDWSKVHAERSIGYYDGNAGTWHVRGIFPYPGTVAAEMDGNRIVQYLTNSKGLKYDGKSGITDTNADWRVFAPVNVEDKSDDIGIVFYGRATRNGAVFAVFGPDGKLLTSKRIAKR